MSNGSGFIDIQTKSLQTQAIVTEGIVKGWLYEFRYRTRNQNGWSDYSPTTIIRAAINPAQP